MAEELEEPLDDLPPGTYTVDEEGNVREALNWQPVIERIQWERLNEFLNDWGRQGTRERIVNLLGMYVLAALTILIVGFLAWTGHLDGQATAGFLGASIGYLLSRAPPRGGR